MASSPSPPSFNHPSTAALPSPPGYGNWTGGIVLPSNGCSKSDLHLKVPSKVCRLKFSGKPIVSLLSDGSKLIPISNNEAAWKITVVDDRVRKQTTVDLSTQFGTVAAELVSSTTSFFSTKHEYDLDVHTSGLSSIPEAIEDIRRGKLVIVVDDEDRENEGDLIMAASLETMAFIVKHGMGIVCVSMKEEDLERLQLPLMVTQKENEEMLCTTFTLSVVYQLKIEPGLFGYLRQRILNLKTSIALVMFSPLNTEGGVLKRADHTEASIDLAMLAGLDPVGVLCEIVDNDDSMASLPKLCQFAETENLKIISIADLIRYRRKRDKLVVQAAVAPLPTMWGPFRTFCFRSLLDGIEHIAMVKGDIGERCDVLVRVHSECLTGDIFGSARCDFRKQLAHEMKQIEATGRGGACVSSWARRKRDRPGPQTSRLQPSG